MEQEYINGLGVGISNSFRDIQQFLISGGVGLTQWAKSNVLHILPATQGTRIYIHGLGVGI
jgi:hypothetical protein